MHVISRLQRVGRAPHSPRKRGLESKARSPSGAPHPMRSDHQPSHAQRWRVCNGFPCSEGSVYALALASRSNLVFSHEGLVPWFPATTRGC